MKDRDPFSAWASGLLGQRVLGLRESERGGVFGAVISERKPGSAHCRIGSGWFVNFGSAEVLGLDQQPFFAEELATGSLTWGTSCGASRVYQAVSPCVDLENGIAKIAGCEDAILFNSVTTAHCGVIPSLARRGRTRFLLDAFVHNSVHRACEIAAARGADVAAFKHNDLADLRRQIAEDDATPVIAVDSIYSMTGEFAPLHELADIADEANGYLYVDDAHGTGLYGACGGGYVTEVFGTVPDHVLVAGSLSKALCGYGGFLAGPQRLRPFIECAAEGFLFNGPIPAPYLVADQGIIQFLQSADYAALLERVHQNRLALQDALRLAGLCPVTPESHILAADVGEGKAIALGRKLFAGGILANIAVFPAVPHGHGVVRFTPSVFHTDEDIASLSRALATA